jgi:hypothetical protein
LAAVLKDPISDEQAKPTLYIRPSRQLPEALTPGRPTNSEQTVTKERTANILHTKTMRKGGMAEIGSTASKEILVALFRAVRKVAKSYG